MIASAVAAAAVAARLPTTVSAAASAVAARAAALRTSRTKPAARSLRPGCRTLRRAALHHGRTDADRLLLLRRALTHHRRPILWLLLLLSLRLSGKTTCLRSLSGRIVLRKPLRKGLRKVSRSDLRSVLRNGLRSALRAGRTAIKPARAILVAFQTPPVAAVSAVVSVARYRRHGVIRYVIGRATLP